MSLGIQVFRDLSPDRVACERALATAGIRLPLAHRAGWARARPDLHSLLVGLRQADGVWAVAFGVHVSRSRALPGFRVLRVDRFGEALPRTHWADAVAALAEVARRDRRMLRLSVEVFSRDADTRVTLRGLLERSGFTRAATVRNWDRTLALDLEPSQDALLASFSPTARRAIRATAKLPLQVRSVEDPRLQPRLVALLHETFARTGARYPGLWDWPGVIELSREQPDASRLLGLFRTDRDGPDALLGFAWASWNGESVSYLVGASSRPSDLHGVGLMYPLFWDLILWAKRCGAAWFDLGGVTTGTAHSRDPVGGISDFKRLFSKQMVDVAEDWVFEPRPVPARLAALVSSGAAWLSRVARR